MLYVDIKDICRAYEVYALNVLNGKCKKSKDSISHIVNVYYLEPITILELAEIVKESVIECTSGKVRPKIEIVDKDIPPLFNEEDKYRIKVNLEKAKLFLGLEKLKSPKESITEVVKAVLVKC